MFTYFCSYTIEVIYNLFLKKRRCICNLFFYFPEPHTFIIGDPDMYVDIGSMLNLSCVVSYTERPPVKVSWLHNGIEISFRGPRSGVSVSHLVYSTIMSQPSGPLKQLIGRLSKMLFTIKFSTGVTNISFKHFLGVFYIPNIFSNLNSNCSN